jgi:hypothetical protein
MVLGVSAVPAQAGRPGAKVVVGESRHDFGDVFAGQFMDHVFTIRNEGTEPLTLSDVIPATAKTSRNKPAAQPALMHGFVNVLSGLLPGATAIKDPLEPLSLSGARLSSNRTLEPTPT